MFDPPIDVMVGNGDTIKVLGVGEIEFVGQVDGKTVHGSLSDVYYMPDLATNLTSVGACLSKLFLALRSVLLFLAKI